LSEDDDARTRAADAPKPGTESEPDARAPTRLSELRTSRRTWPSGIPLEAVYDEGHLLALDPPFSAARDLGRPGEPPFTRGIYPEMYRVRPWTMRQYAGFGQAEETNRRFKFLLASGQTGLSVAFDLPTQMGRDADHPLARGEVGRTGVSIGGLPDMETLLADLPLAEISTSMTINATAATLLALYVAVADARGVPRRALSGTIQNDILKEYIARGTYIYPPGPSMRLVADTFAFCRDELPRWNSISISGYHIREAGSDAVQEVAFTLADGLAYLEAARQAGLEIDSFAPRLSFFFNAHIDFLEEIAKYRAARRLWARLVPARFGTRDPRSTMLRFHAQTAGSSLTASQPLTNVVRTTVEALAAVLGGAQSLHTNAYDEALALPTAASAELALRTQQILAYETGVTGTADPLGGAYALEALTSAIETRAAALIDLIDARGGMVAAIEQGFPQREIERVAYDHQRAIEEGRRIVVGQNRFRESSAPPLEALHRQDPASEDAQVGRLRAFRAGRDERAVQEALAALEAAARGTANLLPPIVVAVKASATLGEVADTFRRVFGEHRPT
jgi:methylmalonyl-CoA mutase N-terminal domain/subunit